jgi:hypothetical protein
MNFRQEGAAVMGENRRPFDRARAAITHACEGLSKLTADRRSSIATVAEALETRTLFSVTVNLPLVNPGFDILYKPGSTTITASIPNESATEGFGVDYPVEDLNGNLNLATVVYSDGATGRTVTVPGWTTLPIEHAPSQRPVAAVVNDSSAYPGKTDNFASIFYTPDTTVDATEIRQTLVGTTLLPNSEYILSSDEDEGGTLGLDGGTTGLMSSKTRTTAKDAAGFYRTTKIYHTKANVPAGDITVILGSGGDSDGDFDNVSLQLVYSGTSPLPTPTPTPLLFGAYKGKTHNLQLTQADGTIVTLSMSGGTGYATQDGADIDLQINSASPKANVNISTILGSKTFILGTVNVSGPLNRFSAPLGALAGTLSAAGTIQALSLASITSGQISAAAIGKLQAGTDNGLIYSAGSIGSLKLGAVGGTIDAGGAIGTLAAASLNGATVLSGVNLGAGGATPVAPAAALSYGAGGIGALSISGAVTLDTLVAVAANPVDGIFANGNDIAAGTGQIASITIRGLAAPVARFEAPAFGPVKIDGATLTNLASDPRFITL